MFEKSSLGEQVAEALKDEILSGRLAPKQRIDIGRYASDWNVSSTPMRDAVKRLEAAGLVEVSPRRGVYVSEIDRQELREIFELRTALESLAIRSATARMPEAEAERALSLYRSANEAPDERDRERILRDIDALIHDLAVEYCGNRRLIELIENLRALINWSRSTLISHLERPYAEALPEHIEIAEALCARDGERAAEAMRTHLENSYDRIATVLDERAAGRVNEGITGADQQG